MRRMLLTGGLCWALATPTAAAAEEVTFAFDALAPQGWVLVSVFGSESSYAARRAPIARARVSVLPDGRAVVRLDLPPGRYAALIFHDVDGDDRLSLGREPYGASNNARGLFGPPSWRSAAFSVGTAPARQTLRLRR